MSVPAAACSSVFSAECSSVFLGYRSYSLFPSYLTVPPQSPSLLDWLLFPLLQSTKARLPLESSSIFIPFIYANCSPYNFNLSMSSHNSCMQSFRNLYLQPPVLSRTRAHSCPFTVPSLSLYPSSSPSHSHPLSLPLSPSLFLLSLSLHPSTSLPLPC